LSMLYMFLVEKPPKARTALTIIKNTV
jgi:hypothetical protein